MLLGVTVMCPILITEAPYLFYSQSGCVWTIKGTLVFLALPSFPPPSPSWQCTQSPSACGSFISPRKKFFGFDPTAAGLPGRSPASGLVWFQLGGLHSLAGARWGCPDGHLERCVTGAPCWCFCSCCFTCWMISLIFLCAVCETRGEHVYSGKCLVPLRL